MHVVKRHVPPILVTLAFLAVWEIVGRQAEIFFFPPVSRVLIAFFKVWFGPEAVHHLVPSLLRMVLGYAIACVAGIVVGIAIGSFRTVASALDPLLQFFRAIPPTALVPVSVFVLGIGTVSKVILIAFTVFWPILISAIDGARRVEQERLDTARVFGFGPWKMLILVIVPSALPMIFAGLRVGLSIGLIAIIVSEMVGATEGLGHFITQSQRSFSIPEMYSGIILLGVLGYVLNAVMRLLEQRLLVWNRRDGGEVV